jgi:ankyrin repeat protein
MKLLPSWEEIIAQRYRLLSILGEGGSGITYLAEDLQNSERVALKALSLRHITDWKAIALFEREAHVLAQLNHPAIPRYLEYFHVDTASDRSFYIAQQLVAGNSLYKLVQSGWRASEAQVRCIAIQILEILDYLQQLNPPIIHRDIKPQNIIRSNDGRVFLVDFGAVQNTYHSTFARSSTVVGTFGYMAPEQFIGQAVSATDLYGLGATLLFLLTHRSPADLPTDNLKIDFRSRVQISSEFADWLNKVLEPDVEDRFPSATEALAALRYLKRKVPLKPSSSGKWKRLAGVGIAAVAALALLNYFKNPILYTFGFTPTAIYEAAQEGDIATVRHYLEQGVDVNARGEQGMTPLYLVGSKEVAELLVSRGVDVNARDSYGFTPLHFATTRQVAELLIAKGASVNAKSKFDVRTIPDRDNPQAFPSQEMRSLIGLMPFANIGVTPLHIAQNQEVAALLIAKGADVNAKTDKGNTPLHMVRSPQVASLLIAKGAQVNARNKWGRVPLHLALTQFQSKKTSLLKMKLLLAQGADVNAQDNKGITPLHLAATGNTEEKVKLLLEWGADVDAKDKEGATPLHRAAGTFNSKDIVKLLLAKKADVNVKDKNGKTPLHEAALAFSSKEAAELLLAQGADINAQDNQGKTPLHLAVGNNKDLVELLLAKGANVNAKDNEGETPLNQAGLQEIALMLIAKGADISARDNQGNTLLHKAARNNWMNVVELLLVKSVDVNAINNKGETPLHQAAQNGNDDMVKLLQNHGAIK